ncbi:hypothetical protein HMPREF9098_0643 [Kingella denitrificans ATCC 33394]|uniref:Uncharacterized protein n=1 Tax=Kingella denitrificans ATCC 33394 TaxID=888741 RepID=F0EXT3_9NEIS|nr:hypothetical protein HMPREF9098_0643 [Kingella denitrificans ATCC 33394]
MCGWVGKKQPAPVWGRQGGHECPSQCCVAACRLLFTQNARS